MVVLKELNLEQRDSVILKHMKIKSNLNGPGRLNFKEICMHPVLKKSTQLDTLPAACLSESHHPRGD